MLIPYSPLICRSCQAGVKCQAVTGVSWVRPSTHHMLWHSSWQQHVTLKWLHYHSACLRKTKAHAQRRHSPFSNVELVLKTLPPPEKNHCLRHWGSRDCNAVSSSTMAHLLPGAGAVYNTSYRSRSQASAWQPRQPIETGRHRCITIQWKLPASIWARTHVPCC